MTASILVVEDNYLAGETLCELIRNLGYTVVGPVNSVQSGLARLHDSQVDAAIVDINLHGRRCYELCGELQRHDIPYVFLTGYDAHVVPKEFGHLAILGKPIDPYELRQALAMMTGGTRRPLGNQLLDRLEAPVIGDLRPRLQSVPLMRGERLDAGGSPTRSVWFPTDGLVTLFGLDGGGHRIALGVVGREGMIGGTCILGREPVSIDSVVEQQGQAWRIALDDLRALMDRHEALRTVLMGNVSSLIETITETLIATGLAKIEQRLARWLLIAQSRAASSRLDVTHDHLSDLLGVRRSSITEALHELEGKGAIRSRPRIIHIVDASRLQSAAGGFA